MGAHQRFSPVSSNYCTYLLIVIRHTYQGVDYITCKTTKKVQFKRMVQGGGGGVQCLLDNNLAYSAVLHT